MDLGSMSMMGNSNNNEDTSTVHNKMTQGTGPMPTPSPVPASAVPGSSNGSSATRLADAGSCQRPVSVRGQVMTDEQMETLRRQISVYATICQQLVEMHKATVAQQNAISASRYGQSSTLDSALNSMGHKFASRQRWTPSQTQLQILEKIFQQGNGTPSKQRIKEISMELSQYGQISETNVYNWFQNRRARTKRKQQVGTANGESEFDTDIDSQEEKKARTDRDLSHDSSSAGQYEINSQNWENAGAQQLDAAQKGLQLSQRMAPGEESSSPFIKPDVDGHISTPLNPVGASTSQEFQRQTPVSNTGDTVMHMQKYKSYNVTE